MADMDMVMDVNQDIDNEVTELNNMIDAELEPETSGLDWKTIGLTIVGTLVVEHVVAPKVKKWGAKAVSNILGWLGSDDDDDKPKRKKRKDDDAVDVDEFTEVDDNDDTTTTEEAKDNNG